MRIKRGFLRRVYSWERAKQPSFLEIIFILCFNSGDTSTRRGEIVDRNNFDQNFNLSCFQNLEGKYPMFVELNISFNFNITDIFWAFFIFYPISSRILQLLINKTPFRSKHKYVSLRRRYRGNDEGVSGFSGLCRSGICFWS